MAVAAVDDDVALLKHRKQQLNKVVNGLAGFHHQHDFAGLFQRVRKLRKAVGANDVFAFGSAFDKAGHLGGGSVIDSHGKTFAFHVHHEVFAHNGEADEADIRFFHDVLPFQRCTRALPFQTLHTCSSSAGEA